MLNLPPKFKQAIGSGVVTSLYPLVRIFKDYQIDDVIPDNAESINLSIKEAFIQNLADVYEHYAPLLLNSPSISSKADIINNKYTISSVSLSISNASYNGKIFSDDIPSLLNAVVQVYYAANGLETLDDCLLVYTGTIRRYSQSAETINITLEDLTQQKLKTKIPATLIENELEYEQSDIGKPYPLVYGYVDNSPVIKKGLNTLEIEKPNKEIFGYWSGSDYYQNPSIQQEHPLVIAGYLKQNKYLSVYQDGFISVYETGPKNWGSEPHENIDNAQFYEFNNATSNNSANIVLYPEAYFETTEEGDEEKTFAIPSRMYRPIVDVSFYTQNNGLQGVGIDPNQKFIGYRNDDGSMQKITNNIALFNDTENTNNDDQMAQDLYDEFWSDGPESGEILKFWQPTQVNNARDLGNEIVENDSIDENWKTYYNNYEEAGKFPVDIIQNNDSNSGLNITSTVGNFGPMTGSGCFARLFLNQDSTIGNFPCVTKIFYDACFFTNGNIVNTTGNTTRGSQPRFASFWADKFLISQSTGPAAFIQNLSDWFFNINALGSNPPEFPNSINEMYIDEIASDLNIENDYPDWGRLEYSNGLLHGEEFSNILQTFNTTNAFNSIQFGKPLFGFGGVNYVSANLKEIYVLQDFIIEDYANLDYYASVGGRMKDDSIITTAQDIVENILNEELSYETSVNNQDTDIQDNWQYAFTLNEQKEAKSIIEDMFKSSTIIPTFNSAGQFKFIGVKQIIQNYTDVQFIKKEDILKYSFQLTKLDDIYNSVNVKYKKNYGSGEFDKQTGYNIGGGIYENYDQLTTDGLGYSQSDAYDINYYGKLPEESKLDFKSDYIRDKYTAEKLQKKLLMWYCNQHLITKIDLPPHYMFLEAGDYIKFSELLGDKLAFGYDYTTPEQRNGQLIYDVFFVTKVSKSLSKVSVEAVQIHRGEYGYPSIAEEDVGDIVNGNGDDVTDNYTLPNAEDDPNYTEENINTEEYTYVPDPFLQVFIPDNDILNNGPVLALVTTNIESNVEYNIWARTISESFNYDGYDYVADTEIPLGEVDASNLVNVSVNEQTNSENLILVIDKKIDIYPENAFIEFVLEVKNDINNQDFGYFTQFGTQQPPQGLGDVNGDSYINILDVVLAVNMILGDEELNLEFSDMNQDGVLNVSDVIIIINRILG